MGDAIWATQNGGLEICNKSITAWVMEDDARSTQMGKLKSATTQKLRYKGGTQHPQKLAKPKVIKGGLKICDNKK